MCPQIACMLLLPPALLGVMEVREAGGGVLPPGGAVPGRAPGVLGVPAQHMPVTDGINADRRQGYQAEQQELWTRLRNKC